MNRIAIAPLLVALLFARVARAEDDHKEAHAEDHQEAHDEQHSEGTSEAHAEAKAEAHAEANADAKSDKKAGGGKVAPPKLNGKDPAELVKEWQEEFERKVNEMKAKHGQKGAAPKVVAPKGAKPAPAGRKPAAGAPNPAPGGAVAPAAPDDGTPKEDPGRVEPAKPKSNRGHGNNVDHDDEDNPGRGKGAHGAEPGHNDDGRDDDEKAKK